MIGFAGALQGFFGGFGLPAYAANNVPDGAALPYISYEIACPAPLEKARLRAWVWYRGGDGAAAFAKCAEIADALSEGGAAIPMDGGTAYIFPDAPLAQAVSEADAGVRGVCVTVAVMGAG